MGIGKHTGKQNRGAPRVHQSHTFSEDMGEGGFILGHTKCFICDWQTPNIPRRPGSQSQLLTSWRWRQRQCWLAVRVILTCPWQGLQQPPIILVRQNNVVTQGQIIQNRAWKERWESEGDRDAPGDSRPLWVVLAACYSKPLSHQRLEKIL